MIYKAAVSKRILAGLIPAILAVFSILPAGQNTPAPGAEKRPVLKFTFTERVREETSDNVTSLDDSAADSSAYVRFRTSLMAQWTPGENLELTVRLTNENRYYLAPKSDPKLHENYSINEVFFDYLYLKWKNPARLPVTLTLGRQDLMLGEGFIIFDGGPLDGSRSAYFNGARADWAVGGKNTLMMFYVYQPATDTILPRINDVGQKMVEQAEEGYGFYFTGTWRKVAFESYFFRKNIRATETLPSSGYFTLGGRVQVPFGSNLSLAAEGAYQFGTLGEIDRRGLGGYFHLDYRTDAAFPWPSQCTFGGIYLSGDNPATADKYEGWDPAFSRWPKWSESLIYLLAKESKPAYWTNFVSLYGGLNFALADNIKLALTWHHLTAAERTLPTAFLSGQGTGRGDLGIVKLTYDISSHLQGHFIWEEFKPENFYFSGAQSYAWVRFELLFRY
jgi:hypothetical protein